MAAQPKLTPEQWAEIRDHWQADPRDGYTWLVTELQLPVSAPAVRKTALRDGWNKAAQRNQETIVNALKDKGIVGDVMVSHGSPLKVSPKTLHRETMKTLPLKPEKPEVDPDKFVVSDDLNTQQEIFVREYLVDMDGKAAAIRAGYSAKTAQQQASRLLSLVKVREAISAQMSVRAKRLGADADEVINLWLSIINLDYNEFSQLRRVCCRFCYGRDHGEQFTPAGLAKRRTEHQRERERRLRKDENDDIGEFPDYHDAWYDKRKEPNADCPECHGNGVEEVFFNDTRNLSPAARMVYGGVKVGKEGIEVLTLSKEKAIENIARVLGMFKESEAGVNINVVGSAELSQLFEEKMRQAQITQARVLAERGMTDVEDATFTADTMGDEADGDDDTGGGDGDADETP